MTKDGYYINNKGIKTIILSDIKYLDIYRLYITEIVCNSELQKLYCYDSSVTKLTLNNNLNILWCYNNELIELKLNDKLEKLSCDINTKFKNINSKININIYD